MEHTVLLQRIDPDKSAYRWYSITLTYSADLFAQPTVIIKRGRIGQAGETIYRYFKDDQQANNYFKHKISKKMAEGYSEAEEIGDLWDHKCKLCQLIARAEDDACYIWEFANSILFLNWDQTYLGRSMLVFKKHLPDFFRLAPSELLASLSEIRASEAALRKAFHPEMMNYLFMGNRAQHVHLHLVPRYVSDSNFGDSPFLETSRATTPQLPLEDYRSLAIEVRKHFVEV